MHRQTEKLKQGANQIDKKMNIICGFENYVGNDTKRKNVTKKKKVVNLMVPKLE